MPPCGLDWPICHARWRSVQPGASQESDPGDRKCSVRRPAPVPRRRPGARGQHESRFGTSIAPRSARVRRQVAEALCQAAAARHPSGPLETCSRQCSLDLEMYVEGARHRRNRVVNRWAGMYTKHASGSRGTGLLNVQAQQVNHKIRDAVYARGLDRALGRRPGPSGVPTDRAASLLGVGQLARWLRPARPQCTPNRSCATMAQAKHFDTSKTSSPLSVRVRNELSMSIQNSDSPATSKTEASTSPTLSGPMPPGQCTGTESTRQAGA